MVMSLVRRRRDPRRLTLLLAVAVALAGAAAPDGPAEAATAKRAHKAAAPPRPLDLRLPQREIRLQTEQQQQRRRGGRRGYAARVTDDPWSALADEPAPLVGPGIPRVRDGERLEDDGETGELSLRGLLDGQTFPILTIRLSPAS